MASLFDILHLLADLLELRLHSDDLLGHHRVADLRPDGVDLAVHLLQQEIQAPPHRLGLADALLPPAIAPVGPAPACVPHGGASGQAPSALGPARARPRGPRPALRPPAPSA